MLTKPKIGFAGVGWIGRSRLKAVAESGLANIVSIFDPSEECINESLKIAPDAKRCDSYENLVQDDNVDAIVIATPSAMHRDQAVLAFEHNKSVFCQKPLGRTAAEVKDVIEAARMGNKLLGADFSYRYTEAFRKLYEVISSGEIGKIFSIELKFHNAYGPDKPWFYDMKQSGGGCVLDLGIHLIDLMLVATDFPIVKKHSSKLFSKGTLLTTTDTVEDYADVQLLIGEETVAHLSCSWHLNAGCDAVIEASFYGTSGGVSMNNINGSFFDFEACRYYGTRKEVIASPPDDWGGGAINDWIEKLSKGMNYDASADKYLQSAKILDMIYGRV